VLYRDSGLVQYMFCDPIILRHNSGGSSEGATSGVAQSLPKRDVRTTFRSSLGSDHIADARHVAKVSEADVLTQS